MLWGLALLSFATAAVLARLLSTRFAGFRSMSRMLGLALAAVSLVDDLRAVLNGLRLTLHLAAAVVLAWFLLSPMNAAAIAVVGTAVAWITNAYNFMDGLLFCATAALAGATKRLARHGISHDERAVRRAQGPA